MTTMPVIGVPIQSPSLQGLDSLLAIVQMPSGVPVATVGINGAKNAGLLAAAMLGIKDRTIRAKLDALRITMNDEVQAKADRVESIGWAAYLKGN